jgi:hypothetical protein
MDWLLYCISKLHCVECGPCACLPVTDRSITSATVQQSECKHLWLLTSVLYNKPRIGALNNWWFMLILFFNRVDCCLVSFTSLFWYQIWYAFVLRSCDIELYLDHGSTCSLLQIMIAHRCNMNCNELYIIFAVARSTSSVFCRCV